MPTFQVGTELSYLLKFRLRDGMQPCQIFGPSFFVELWRVKDRLAIFSHIPNNEVEAC